MAESPSSTPESFDALLGSLRAIAEPTRLRLIALLSRAELTVTEITQVIGQSQPRISRHLKLLVDAGLMDRTPEGAFVFYRLSERSGTADLVRRIADLVPLDDAIVADDMAALERVRQARWQAAATYVNAYADDWATIRSLYVAEADVEQDMLDLLAAGDEPIERLLDIGTGTGRILELLAPLSERSIGLDVSHDMLAVARAHLADARIASASVRHGDLHRPPFAASSFDVAVMHHVLHQLADPAAAIADARRLLKPSGRLLIVDFAPHDLDFLRDGYGHRHLGIADDDMEAWAADAGLTIETQRSLLPAEHAIGERLTVRLWLLRAPNPATQQPRTMTTAQEVA
jgi:SAM-dependent methyltransferase